VATKTKRYPSEDRRDEQEVQGYLVVPLFVIVDVMTAPGVLLL